MSDLFVPGVVPPKTSGDELWLYVGRSTVLAASGHAGPNLRLDLAPAELGLDARDPIFLGTLDGALVWAVDAGGDDLGHEELSFVDLRALYSGTSETRWVLAGRAVQLVEWQRTHRFCGRCSSPTHPVDGDRAMRCPVCELLCYPRLAPAVIVLIERGDEVLLARGRAFNMPMYSALAGFVEPGETLEQAVHREVREEVGVRLGEVRYFGSQPWPFPNSLMIGFTATWLDGDIEIDPSEIADANWYRYDELPMVPPRMSIAGHLIGDFVARQG